MRERGPIAASRLLVGVLVAVLALVSGCFNRKPVDVARYTFAIDRPAVPPRAGGPTIRVGLIRPAPLFERKGFVYRTGDLTYESDFYNEFFSPPGRLVREQVADWLRGSGAFGAILIGGSIVSEWQLEGRLRSIYGDLRDPTAVRAVVEIEFDLVRRGSKDLVLQESYRAEAIADAPGPDALVRAWSTALAEILGSLEADLTRVADR